MVYPIVFSEKCIVKFTLCVWQIPLTSASQFGPVSISSKTFAYLLGAQLALSSKDSLGKLFWRIYFY